VFTFGAKHVPAGQEVDLLNIDCEGVDFEVLQSNDFSAVKPKVISVEIHGLDLCAAAENETVRFLYEQGYKLVSFVQLTAIFVR